jgi:hypothetical protein
MEVSGQLHAPATLPPGNSPWYPLDRRLCESQSRSERGGEEKKFPAPAGNRTPVHPARSLALFLVILFVFADNKNACTVMFIYKKSYDKTILGIYAFFIFRLRIASGYMLRLLAQYELRFAVRHLTNYIHTAQDM